jgi:hypothetical protein
MSRLNASGTTAFDSVRRSRVLQYLTGLMLLLMYKVADTTTYELHFESVRDRLEISSVALALVMSSM